MNGALALVAAGLMADDAPHHTGPDFGKASPFGLAIVVLLLVGTLFLVWSMNRHLRKLPESFDRNHPEPDLPDDPTVGTEGNAAPDNGSPPREPG